MRQTIVSLTVSYVDGFTIVYSVTADIKTALWGGVFSGVIYLSMLVADHGSA